LLPNIEVRMQRSIVAILIAVPLFAGAAPPQIRAVAIMRDAAGKQAGTATLAQEEGGVRVAIGVKGLAPGRHGFHLHAVAKCDFPEFLGAGPHFNPGQKPHGPTGSPDFHAGDLPELEADSDGFASTGFMVRGVTLSDGPASLLAGAGTALVIDAKPDDGKAEGGGKRVACGVVTRR
jgi:Cu-Zn family superoxide dismutase